MRAVFLDRDGVINKTTESGFVFKWSEFELLPHVIEAIKYLNKLKIPVIVISNQSCVGRGMITYKEVEAINSRMRDELKKNGAKLDDIFFCPHGPDEGCRCRKPEPGMLLDAAKKHNIDLADSWFIGDSDTDVEAGKRAGCNTYLLKRGEVLLSTVKKLILK